MSTREIAERYMVALEARDWSALEETLHDDLVYETQQTRERVRGRAAFIRFNQEFPGDWHLVPHRFVADDESAVVWFRWRIGDTPLQDGLYVFDVRDGRISAINDFWPEPYEPSADRAHLVERW